MDIKIRPLLRSDRKKLTAMIESLAVKFGSTELLNLISSTIKTDKENNSGSSVAGVGIQVINLLREFLEDDFCNWLAELINKTPEEFNNLPFDIEVQIIEQIVNAPEFENFFTGASRLANKIKKFLPQS